MTNLVVLLCVLAAATAVGLLMRARSGRLRPTAPSADPYPPGELDPALAALGVRPEAADVTFVQFSSAFCAPCRATKALLSDVAHQVEGVRHIEVDAESHLDEVRALGVLRTPTTLIVDGSGRVVSRASGVPRRADILATVRALTDDVSRSETA